MSEHEVRWMFHSTAMVPSYDAALDSMATLFGMRVLEYSEQLTPEIGRRGGMTWVGDNSLELGQPIVPGAGADKFVRRTGGGVHSIAVQISDVDATVAHLEANGVRIAARPGHDFIFTDQRDTAGVFIEWGAIELPEDPHFGVAPPPFTCDPLLNVTHHAFIGALVQDVDASATRLSKLFGTPVTFRHPDAPLGSPRAGVSAGDCTLTLYEFDEASSGALWGRSINRPRTHLIGLRVDDLEVAAERLTTAGVGILRRDRGQLYLDPAATGEVAVVLVDELPPGDPRI